MLILLALSQVIVTMIMMIIQERHRFASLFQNTLALYLYAHHSAKGVFDTLCHLNLSTSFPTVHRAVKGIGESQLAAMRALTASGAPIVMTVDNVEAYAKVAHEGVDNHDHLRHFMSGFAVEAFNPHGAAPVTVTELEEARSKAAGLLAPHDLLLQGDELKRLHTSMTFQVVALFLRDNSPFNGLQVPLQPNPESPPIPSEKAPILVFQTLEENESTMDGLVRALVGFQGQMGMTAEFLERSDNSIMLNGDVKTLQGVLAAQTARERDVDPLQRLAHFNPHGQGFHLNMAATSLINTVHNGARPGSENPASVNYGTRVLGRRALAAEKPNFKRSRDNQVDLVSVHIKGLLLSKTEGKDVDQLRRDWQAAPDGSLARADAAHALLAELHSRAERLVVDWIIVDVEGMRAAPAAERDQLDEGLRLFVRDAVIVCELRSAIKFGNMRRLQTVLMFLVAAFRGAPASSVLGHAQSARAEASLVHRRWLSSLRQ